MHRVEPHIDMVTIIAFVQGNLPAVLTAVAVVLASLLLLIYRRRDAAGRGAASGPRNAGAGGDERDDGGAVGGGRPTNDRIGRFSLQQLREQVVLHKTNKNRRSTLDGGDLTPQDCLSYMQAVLDRVVAVQNEAQAAGLTISESDQRIFQEIKDTIAGQVDAMTGSDVSEELRDLKRQLLQDTRAAIPTNLIPPRREKKFKFLKPLMIGLVVGTYVWLTRDP
jgi:hypothetical protein